MTVASIVVLFGYAKISDILTGLPHNPKGVAYVHYTYRVTWSEEDGEYVGLCAEYPSLSWLASEPEAAITASSF